jgi:hypothetical protein
MFKISFKDDEFKLSDEFDFIDDSIDIEDKLKYSIK